ncbi:hypothetical protein [Rummeliibacillus sp. TYF-LIM-RU47]|uniref:hypothetical protein n=1 Tax=Rummeliibacillus sp. TYF-LIM-RU47 TaxID=2608406 RepID=UPI00123BF6B0|nr:hypothetical protein [Rummeliibacillus sp. TYF-LIM-RU47]
MDKKSVGKILSFTSLVPVIVSIIIFFKLRGPDADIYMGITIFSVLSITGITLAIVSWILSKKSIPFSIVGLLGNAFVLIGAFLLILAMGISPQ